eukprot:766683-Hanusia_phi.AAC.2
MESIARSSPTCDSSPFEFCPSCQKADGGKVRKSLITSWGQLRQLRGAQRSQLAEIGAAVPVRASYERTQALVPFFVPHVQHVFLG